jgi:RND superfamily putative drug exporter
MSRLLGRLGGATAAHPWRTIAAWLLVLVGALGSPRRHRRTA